MNNTVRTIDRVIAAINEMTEALSSALKEHGDRVTDALAKAAESASREGVGFEEVERG